jgi:DNA-binding transcriptional regulator LsrR (DeoR family)
VTTQLPRADGDPTGPDADDAQLRLAAVVARRYYLHRESKTEIAARLGISRFKVARLLDRAHAEGIVRIEIADPFGVDVELSQRVADLLGLRRALVLGEAANPKEDVGALAARHLRSIVRPGDTVGIAWSRSTEALVAQLRLPSCTIVQLCGVIPKVAAADDEAHNVELVRQAAKQCGGAAITFYAPLVVPDAGTAATLRRQPGIADALHRCDKLDAAVIAIGQWQPGASTVYDALPHRERVALARRGAIAESAGMLFEQTGKQLRDGLQRRVIAVTERQLRRAGEVLALVSEPERVPAIQALASTGMVSTLVTHRAVAERLVASARDAQHPAGATR